MQMIPQAGLYCIIIFIKCQKNVLLQTYNKPQEDSPIGWKWNKIFKFSELFITIAFGYI